MKEWSHHEQIGWFTDLYYRRSLVISVSSTLATPKERGFGLNQMLHTDGEDHHIHLFDIL